MVEGTAINPEWAPVWYQGSRAPLIPVSLPGQILGRPWWISKIYITLPLGCCCHEIFLLLPNSSPHVLLIFLTWASITMSSKWCWFYRRSIKYWTVLGQTQIISVNYNLMLDFSSLNVIIDAVRFCRASKTQVLSSQLQCYPESSNRKLGLAFTSLWHIWPWTPLEIPTL